MSNTRTTTAARAAKKAAKVEPASLPDEVEFEFDGQTYSVDTGTLADPTLAQAEVMEAVDREPSARSIVAFFRMIGLGAAAEQIRASQLEDFFGAFNAAIEAAEEMNLGE